MKKTIVVALFILIGSTLVYCYAATPTYSWHQKMTVELDSNGKIITGSSVVQMKVEGIPGSTAISYGPETWYARRGGFGGESPQKRYLFALLTYDVFLTGKVFHDLLWGRFPT